MGLITSCVMATILTGLTLQLKKQYVSLKAYFKSSANSASVNMQTLMHKCMHICIRTYIVIRLSLVDIQKNSTTLLEHYRKAKQYNSTFSQTHLEKSFSLLSCGRRDSHPKVNSRKTARAAAVGAQQLFLIHLF